MIRCRAFCLSLSHRAAAKAVEAAGGIDRARVKLSTFAVAGFSSAHGQEPALTILEAEGDEGGGAAARDLPVVHGQLGETPEGGEYSVIRREGSEGSLVASRDAAGTRPLFVGQSGDWVASDHRFFRDEARRLLPPAARYGLSDGRTTLARVKTGPRWSEDFDQAASAAARLIDECVRDRVQERRKVAVAFSGGLDSSILVACAKHYAEVVACSVHAARAPDELKARRAAEELDVDLVSEELDVRRVAAELSSMDVPFEPSAMDRSLWCIYSVAARLAVRSGAEVILLGQLADELFGGYYKYQRAVSQGGGPEEAEEMMRADVAECGVRGLLRDEIACARWLEPRFPFADGRMLDFGLRVPVGFKLRAGVRKALLRSTASILGVPEGLAASPKKAAQYSSGIAKLLR